MFSMIANSIANTVSVDFITSCLPENSVRIYQAVKKHFNGQTDPLDEILKESYKSTLKGLSVVLSDKVSKLSAQETKAFKEKFETEFWHPYIRESRYQTNIDHKRLKLVCEQGCKQLLDKIDDFQINIDHDELAKLLFEVPKKDEHHQSIQRTKLFEKDAKKDIRRQIERAHLDELTTDFLLFNDLLYSCLIARLQDNIKHSSTVQGIFNIYQQNKLSVNIDTLQVNFEQSQVELKAELLNLQSQMANLMQQMTNNPQDITLIQKISQVSTQQMALQKDLQHFDQRFREIASQLTQVSADLNIFHCEFNHFALHCEEKLDHIHDGVNDIRGKVDHLIDIIQNQATPISFEHLQSEDKVQPKKDTLSQLKEFLEQQIRTSASLKVYSEQQERLFFMEAALLNIQIDQSTLLLKETLHHASLIREQEIFEQIKQHLEPSLLAGYLSPNEFENILFMAEKQDITREKVTRLIQDECLRVNCINGVELAERFKKFLEISYPQGIPFQDLTPFFEWAERNQLKRRDARSILRAHCAPHPLPFRH